MIKIYNEDEFNRALRLCNIRLLVENMRNFFEVKFTPSHVTRYLKGSRPNVEYFGMMCYCLRRDPGDFFNDVKR